MRFTWPLRRMKSWKRLSNLFMRFFRLLWKGVRSKSLSNLFMRFMVRGDKNETRGNFPISLWDSQFTLTAASSLPPFQSLYEIRLLGALALEEAEAFQSLYEILMKALKGMYETVTFQSLYEIPYCGAELTFLGDPFQSLYEILKAFIEGEFKISFLSNLFMRFSSII